jgi:cyanophycinase
MRNIAVLLFSIGCWGLFSSAALAEEDAKFEPRGSLIVVGGGDTPANVQERLVALAGGPGKARIAVLPMAGTKFDEEAREVIEELKQLKAEAVLVNISRDEAKKEATAKYLEAFTGYWFLGGDQSRLAATLLGTRALETIERRFEEGAVIGGTSAGAAVMSNAMLTGRGRRLRGPEAAELRKIARGMADVSTGFGFFPGAIVDQHFMQRARYNRLLSAVLEHPQLLGVGIDEETALLVRPDGVWEVLGSHYVKIFDARRARILEDDDALSGATDIRMHILPAGSLYSPKRRHALLPGG